MDAHRCFSRFWSVLALTFLAAFALAATQAAPAHAQDANPDVLNKVTKLNKRALDAYQKKDYTGARNLLKEAIDLCANSGLAKHPIKARTHIHLGVVLINGFKQRDAGIAHFKKALQIQPDIQLTKTIATPALQEAFEEAAVGLGSGPAAADDGTGGPQAGNDDSAGGGAGDEAGGDDNPQPRRKAPAKKKKHRGDDDDDEGGAVSKRGDGDDDDDDDGVGVNNAGKIFIGLTLGSGFGIASGDADIAPSHTLAQAGFAAAQLGHISPEVGYYLSSKLLLSLQGRFQYVSGLNPGPTTCNVNGATMACVPKKTALAGFARATYFMLEGEFHFFFGGSLGFGTIRHVSLFEKDTSCGSGHTQCVDSVKAGPLLVGPNVGITYDLTKNVALVVSLNTQLGVPRFTFNLDGNIGAGVKF
jgi:tetratricopeptide (TPR) repeat protein